MRKTLLFVSVIFALSAALVAEEYWINENFQDFGDLTTGTTGNYSWPIDSDNQFYLSYGKLLPNSNGYGDGSKGAIQITQQDRLLEFPWVPDAGKLEIVAYLSGNPRAFILQKKKRGAWVNVQKLNTNSQGSLQTIDLNEAEPLKLRISQNSTTTIIYDLRITKLSSLRIALDAQVTTHNSFVANWDQDHLSDSYKVSVFQKQQEYEFYEEDLENWDETTQNKLPIGWSVSNEVAIHLKDATKARSGEKVLRFGNNSHTASTAEMAGISRVSFYVKPLQNQNNTIITISKYLSGATHPIQSFSTDVSQYDTTAFTKVEVCFDNIEPGYFELTYQREGSNYLYVDDFAFGSEVLVRDEGSTSEYISSTSSIFIDGLQPDTDYYYVIQGVNDGVLSEESNEIHVKTAASECLGFPNNVAVPLSDLQITFIEGEADLVGTPLSNVPNPDFISYFAHTLELKGAGPWQLQVEAEVEKYPWIAYHYAGQWYSLLNPDGMVQLTIPSGRSNILELRAGIGSNPTLPVLLNGFTAEPYNQSHVQLTWVSQSEYNLQGYYVYRSETADLFDAILISDLIPATNTSNVQFYAFSDTELEHDAYYYYWLQSVEISGEISWHGPMRVFWQESLSDQGHTIPMQTKLMNAYPNPFNPVTSIPYQLQKAGEVRMDVFNLKGQKVRSFSQIHDNAGFYSFIWDGLDFQGISLASGVYLYRMSCEGYCEIKRLVLKK